MSSFQQTTLSDKKAKEVSIENVLAKAFQKGLPLAVWRLPEQEEFHLVIGMETQIVSIDSLENRQGFIISPFIQQEECVFFVPADLHFKIEIKSKKPVVRTNHVKSASLEPLEVQALLDDIQHVSKDKLDYHIKQHTEEPLERARFIAMVNQAVEDMEAQRFQKVVLSRYKKEPLSASFHLLNSFLKLSETYPDAFISLVSTPETGTWMGASPEILVEVNTQNRFKTVALAGTQKRDLFPSLKEVTWRQKEIEEQAMVSRYIINCFKKIRLREFEEIGPRTVAAGGVVHLRTDFLVDLKETNFMELGAVMLRLLHPTSAVCGMPKAEALQFLKNHEDYDRKLFSGFLGPLNIEESTNLFVNLRCVQLTKTHIIYYAGAGITADSIAEKEWEETALKMETVAACI